MALADFESLLKDVTDFGIPLIITVGVIFLIWKISKIIPDALKNYIESGQDRDKKQQEYLDERQRHYDKQMEVIITVAQEGVEAQKRGNEVIERNNIIMEAQQANNNQLVAALGKLTEQSRRTEDSTCGNREIANKIYAETIRLTERISQK